MAGAGPGGLYAALEALKRGLSVYVFDKKTVVGTPVKCGEYFPVRREMQDLLPSAGEYMNVFDVPQTAINNTCKTLRMISPRGREYEFDFEAFILDRTILEQHMAREVEKLGGTIQLRTVVICFKEDGVISSGQVKVKGFGEELESPLTGSLRKLRSPLVS